MRESVPPIMTEKLIQITAKMDDVLIIPCVSYANPRPNYRYTNYIDDNFQVLSYIFSLSFSNYRWHVRKKNRDETIDNNSSNNRLTVQDGTMTINPVKNTDAGTYFCTATNAEGSETLEVQLSITSSLTVHIQPAQQTVDLGKSAELVSDGAFFLFVSGHLFLPIGNEVIQSVWMLLCVAKSYHGHDQVLVD